LTPQRRILIDIIHESDCELTTDYILSRVKEKMPEVHKSTVYRNLDTLEQAGCVYKSDVGGRVVYHHADHGEHCHLVCQICGKAIDCNEDLVEPVLRDIFDRTKFRIDTHNLILKGICSDCSES